MSAGGGPAGMMLGLPPARKGVAVAVPRDGPVPERLPRAVQKRREPPMTATAKPARPRYTLVRRSPGPADAAGPKHQRAAGRHRARLNVRAAAFMPIGVWG
ncbi:hypothetical protein [Nonomuraea sp. NPDC049400]|uniref:hypothetical protein n=1 Tax=Nonomuraea sp. NPDC049400 TaxID=3364352 RepID=UPI0037A1A672